MAKTTNILLLVVIFYWISHFSVQLIKRSPICYNITLRLWWSGITMSICRWKKFSLKFKKKLQMHLLPKRLMHAYEMPYFYLKKKKCLSWRFCLLEHVLFLEPQVHSLIFFCVKAGCITQLSLSLSLSPSWIFVCLQFDSG